LTISKRKSAEKHVNQQEFVQSLKSKIAKLESNEIAIALMNAWNSNCY